MFSKFAKRDEGGKSGAGPSGRKKGTVYVHESGSAKRKKAAFFSAANDPKQSKLTFFTPTRNSPLHGLQRDDDEENTSDNGEH